MLETLIKRSGQEEAFSNTKSNAWMIWGGDDVLNRMDWSSIIMEARAIAPTKMTTQDWQQFLVDRLKVRGSQPDGWPYMLMAGRLYTVLLMKKIHGDDYPHLKDHIKTVHDAKLTRDLGYSDDEIDFLQEFVINHKSNLKMAYSQVEQYQQKYALRNRGTGEVFETPQFTMMRMAMAVYENHEPIERLHKVRDLYLVLNADACNPPTPNYSALGTNHYGMASCCLISADDDALSIKVADIIAYAMTLASAGIGIQLSTRSPGDPVDNGRVDHAGRLNYIRMFVASASANKQGMRGGALNVYDLIYNPEIEMMANLQNPKTPIEVRERRVNVTYQTNRLFHNKVADREKYFTFTRWSAPDLYEAFFKADQTEFEELYAKYEADPNFKKNYRDAFDTLVMLLEQETEVSTLFWQDIGYSNQHTPFKDAIRQSNLCVAPTTKIMTDQGYKVIKDLVGQKVNVWNGEQFSNVEIVKTSSYSRLLTVKTSFGFTGQFTEGHKWYINIDGQELEVRTHSLKAGMKLVSWDKPSGVNSTRYSDASYLTEQEALEAAYNEQLSGLTVKIIQDETNSYRVCEVQEGEVEEIIEVIDNEIFDETYCFNEPIKHRGVFNGMFTGQCVEVVVPTNDWSNILDLYGDGDPEKGEVGICNIGSVPQHNLPFNPNNPLIGYEEVKKAVRGQYEIIAYAIENSDYHFPAIEKQAKARRNASVGMSGVATLFAKLNLKFNTPEGRRAWHILNERHAYACIEVALEMGIEKGNAPWIHRTKWPDGWMPIDTYKKHLDTVVDSTLYFDWSDLRARVIANGGIYFSCLIAHMPGEQATRKGTGSNSVYPLFNLSVDLSDGSSAIPWAALDNDIMGEQYQMAWDMEPEDMAIHYGICQKFTDQAISADYYVDRVKYPEIPAVKLVDWFLARVRYGTKTKYYTRSRTYQEGAQANIVLKATADGTSKLAIEPIKEFIPIIVESPKVMSALEKAFAAAQAMGDDDGLGQDAFIGCGLDGSCTN